MSALSQEWWGTQTAEWDDWDGGIHMGQGHPGYGGPGCAGEVGNMMQQRREEGWWCPPPESTQLLLRQQGVVPPPERKALLLQRGVGTLKERICRDAPVYIPSRGSLLAPY